MQGSPRRGKFELTLRCVDAVQAKKTLGDHFGEEEKQKGARGFPGRPKWGKLREREK